MSTRARKKTHQEEIVLNLLNKRKFLKTTEAAEALNVSECTIRRLFDELEQKGDATRVYGGIKRKADETNEYRFENLQLIQSEQKHRIGMYASNLIKSGDVFFIDAGTTMQQMALALVERIRNHELQDIQVFTNSLRNLTILSDYCEVNLIGGMFRNGRQDFCGYLSTLLLDMISFEKCFLGADGISLNPNDGIMAIDVFTAKISQTVLQRANSVYLMADSSKFTKRSFIKYASLEDIYMIITDSNLPQTIEAEISAIGTQVVKA